MSLLWPDKLSGGLFPGYCWIQRRGGDKVISALPVTADTAAAMLATLDEMLEGQGTAMRKGTAVSLIVSDGLGAVTVLPWQDQLSTPDEVGAYAAACFERQGIEVGANWVMHAEFRAYGRVGLAYALPRAWLDALAQLLEARGLRLDRVLPVTAMAYWRHGALPKSGSELVLLREAQRITAMVYGSNGLQALDVEAVTAMQDTSLERLLRRVGAYYPGVRTVWDWSPLPMEDADLPSYTLLDSPDTVARQLRRLDWS